MKIRLLLLVVLFPASLFAQGLTEIESLLESHEALYSEEEYEDIVNTLQKLQVVPLDLNTAGFDSLKMLFFISDNQIDNILSFRRHWVFTHINELLLVPGISERDLNNIRQFAGVGEGVSRKQGKEIPKIMHELLGRTRINVPKQEGYKRYALPDLKNEREYERKQQTRFKGMPMGTLLKYKLALNGKLQLGITLENDPGEPYFTRYQKSGFDFLSAHASFSMEKVIDRVIIGDYRIQWGQGLVIWSGFSSGKSAMAVNNEKPGSLVAPYTSTNENRFLRGVAIGLKPTRTVSSDFFFSYKKTDGNVVTADSLTEEELTASLYESGYHRNENEIKKKHVLKELTIGASVRWNTNKFKVGANVVHYHFHPGITVGSDVYNRYDDHGKRRFVGSIDYKTSGRNIYFFGETAINETGALATLNGVRFSGSSKAAMSVVYRHYDERYISRYASGFAEYSNTSNEEGLYMGLNLNLWKNIKLNGYYDFFRFFTPRYNAFTPASGHEMLCELIYNYRKFEHIIRYKEEVKPENYREMVILPVRKSLKNARYQMKYSFSERLEIQARFNLVYYNKVQSKENGYLVCNDWAYSMKKDVLKMHFRFAWFNTDSYQSRVYAYENNVLYAYSFSAYYGKGVRTYLNLSAKLNRMFTFYAKAGLTIYRNRESIGSSLTKVEGNKLFDLSFQIRARF